LSYDTDRGAPCFCREVIDGYSLISGEDAMPTGLLMFVIVEKGELWPFLYPTTLSN
jgi:hypothetical protein